MDLYEGVITAIKTYQENKYGKNQADIEIIDRIFRDRCLAIEEIADHMCSWSDWFAEVNPDNGNVTITLYALDIDMAETWHMMIAMKDAVSVKIKNVDNSCVQIDFEYLGAE